MGDHRKIVKRNGMVSLNELKEMILLESLATAAGEHYNNDEIRDEKGSLDQQ